MPTLADNPRSFFARLDEQLAPLTGLATAIWLFDVQECRWVWGNDAACEIWRGTRDEIRSRDIRTTQSDAMYEYLNDLLARLETEPHITEWLTLQPKGIEQRYYLSHQRCRLPDGRYGVLSEAAMEPPAEEIIELAANTTLTVALYDTTGALVSSNPAYRELFSRLSHDTTLASLVPGRPRLSEWIAGVEFHVPTITEVELPTSRGKRWFRVEHRKVAASHQQWRILSSFFDITETRLEQMELRRLASTDGLTGLLNRHAVVEATRTRIERGAPFELVYIDLDRLKRVNDLFGHVAGDAMLRAAADRLREVCGDATIGRIGGDEFVAMYAHGACSSTAILHALQQPFSYAGSWVNAGASVGVAHFPDHATDAERLIRCGDRAMYDAKEHGRGRTVVYNKDLAATAERAEEVAHRLKGAIAAGEVFAVVQPIVDLENRRVIGGECLARWMSPQLGFVGPDEFVAVAEQCNLTQDLAAMMANTAVRLLNEATSPQDRDATLSINLSTLDLCDDALVETLVDILVANPSAAGRLYVELTERVDSLGMREMRQNLDRIKATGCRLALDDFGAGYSSLTWVEALPVDLLKIDRSLISRCTEARGRTMVEMVIAAAATLGIPCVAEGVETEDEAQILTDLGAQRAQGYYFARPLAIDDWRAYPGTRRP